MLLKVLYTLLFCMCAVQSVSASTTPGDTTTHTGSYTNQSQLSWFTVKDNHFMPKDVLLGNKEYQFFLHFTIDSCGTANHIMLYIQYCADEPLHYYEAIFIINGNNYSILTNPSHIKPLQGKKRYYLEISDTEIREQDKELLDALVHNHGVTLKLKGADGFTHVIPLDEKFCKGFSRSIMAYRNLGGSL